MPQEPQQTQAIVPFESDDPQPARTGWTPPPETQIGPMPQYSAAGIHDRSKIERSKWKGTDDQI
jgi:hypothetical protein